MPRFRWCCIGNLLAAVLLAAGTLAAAETCTLELKRLGPMPSGPLSSGSAREWVFRSTSAQHFAVRFGQNAYRPPNADAEFKAVVKKEPEKYFSKEPFRGVIKLGSGQFGFVLDAKDEKSQGYDRLHFDLNANGDLTDDKPIDAEPSRSARGTGPQQFGQNQFPRVDLTIPVDGKPQEYAFLVQVYWSGSQELRYASAQFQAAAYRAGEITLDGKKHQVALLDFNGNGRFDDQTKILPNAFYSGGGIVAEMGDVLLIDSDRLTRPSIGRTFDDEGRQYLSKLARIAGRYYDVKVSATGDQLTLTPSPLKTGYLTNPNGPFTGMIYGDRGFLPFRGEAGKPVDVPEGEWRLLSYNIQITGWKPPPPPPPEKQEPAKGDAAEKNDATQKKPKPKNLLEAVSRAVTGSKASEPPRAEPRYGPAGMCAVDAHGTKNGKPVTVRAGETVTLPFGPPYKPVVEAFVGRWAPGAEVQLSMTVVGSGGEVLSNLVVDGYRPPKPEFTITDPKGEVVQKGSFEYG